MDGVVALLGVAAILSAMSIIFAIVMYILQAVALTRAANYLGHIGDSWMAWVPVVNYVYLADIAVEDDEKESNNVHFWNMIDIPYKAHKYAGVLAYVLFLLISRTRIPNLFGYILIAAVAGFYYYRVYRKINFKNPYENETNDMILGIVSSIITVIPAIYFLQGKYKEPVPKYQQPRYHYQGTPIASWGVGNQEQGYADYNDQTGYDQQGYAEQGFAPYTQDQSYQQYDPYTQQNEPYENQYQEEYYGAGDYPQNP